MNSRALAFALLWLWLAAAQAGDRPADAPANRDLLIYAGAILAIPVVWFLFTNLMCYVPP